MSRQLLLCLGVAGIVAACTVKKPLEILNSVTPESGYTVQSSIAYGKNKRQTFDVYHPDSVKEGSPVLVFIYGGAWRKGSKEDYKFVGEAFSTQGYQVIIPDYRLYPEVQYPDIITDVYESIVYLQEQRAQLTIKSDQIVLMGHSSGAHAAALLGSSVAYFGESDFITAIVGLAGPYDLPLENEEVHAVFASTRNEASVNPIELVTPLHPETLLLHGDDDERVAPWHTLRYERRLRSVGVPVRAEILSGVGHADIVAGLATPLEFLNSTKQRILSFLNSLDGISDARVSAAVR